MIRCVLTMYINLTLDARTLNARTLDVRALAHAHAVGHMDLSGRVGHIPMNIRENMLNGNIIYE